MKDWIVWAALTAMFQFPSNGKGERKSVQGSHQPVSLSVSIPFKRERGAQGYHHQRCRTLTEVSIPFKRERGAQGDIRYTTPNQRWKECFNSLQTGKGSASHIAALGWFDRLSFQFPSNGKGERKYMLLRITLWEIMCFNSLQTGKGSASQNNLMEKFHGTFQFPSNGKGERKSISPTM